MSYETEVARITGRIDSIENVLAGRAERKSLPEQIREAPGYQAFIAKQSDMFNLEVKTAIIGTSAQNDPLTPSTKPWHDVGARRSLRLEDAIPHYACQQDAVEIAVKTSSSMGSPAIQDAHNTTIGEAAMAWSNIFEPMSTVASFIPVSAQNLMDQGQLEQITSELAYLLAKEVEDQILNGSGSAGTLSGLIAGATSYTAHSPAPTDPAAKLRDCMRAIAAADFQPDTVVLNPEDWFTIQTTQAGTSDAALVNGPASMVGPSLWGARVYETNSIAAGTWLVMDANRASAIFDRQTTQIAFGRHDDTNFRENMITVRAVRRLAQVVLNAGAAITGSF